MQSRYILITFKSSYQSNWTKFN